jgi:hypothetical protein
MLKLSMKCWNSAFDAQGSRLIIVVVQLGALKIYVAAVEALKRKERQDETQFTTKVDGFFEFHPSLNVNVRFFAGCFKISPCVWPNSGFWCCVFPYFTDNSNVPVFISNSGPNNKPKLPLKVGPQFFSALTPSVKQALYTLKKLSRINTSRDFGFPE